VALFSFRSRHVLAGHGRTVDGHYYFAPNDMGRGDPALFAQVKAAWAADQAQINSTLTATAEAMRVAAGGYRNVDTSVSSRFQAPSQRSAHP